MRNITIKQLKDLIKDLPDETMVLSPDGDHAYRKVHAEVTTALYDETGPAWTEDYGEKMTPEAYYGKRLKVLVIV